MPMSPDIAEVTYPKMRTACTAARRLTPCQLEALASLNASRAYLDNAAQVHALEAIAHCQGRPYNPQQASHKANIQANNVQYDHENTGQQPQYLQPPLFMPCCYAIRKACQVKPRGCSIVLSWSSCLSIVELLCLSRRCCSIASGRVGSSMTWMIFNLPCHWK